MTDGAGRFYGTTQQGGRNGKGTLFEFTPPGGFNVVYDFCEQTNCTDGSMPLAGLVTDASGNLYGTTGSGGSSSHDPDGGGGTVFRYRPSDNTHTVLYNFCSVNSPDSCFDGQAPHAGLIVDSAGNLYGTTAGGGIEFGVVFQLTPGISGYSETVLHRFCPNRGAGCLDGASPEGGLVMDGAGNLYGTTHCGGGGAAVDTVLCGGGGPGGAGVAFQLTNTGGKWNETVIHRFCENPGCTDGGSPVYVGLTMDNAGNLYGTASLGGKFGGGTAFELSLTGFGWRKTVLHHFCHRANCADGLQPYAGLLMDAAGNLYGTTLGQPAQGDPGGVVFKLVPPNGGGWTEKVLHRFCSQSNCADGQWAQGGLIMDSSGDLFGMTYAGGSDAGNPNGSGVIFRLTP